MPEEEFIISSIRAEEEFIIVSFSITNTEERMQNLLSIAEKKWLRQYGKNTPLPDGYKHQIMASGIPPMIMRLPMSQWHNRGFQLNDHVLINVPENIDDIIPVEKKELGFNV